MRESEKETGREREREKESRPPLTSMKKRERDRVCVREKA